MEELLRAINEQISLLVSCHTLKLMSVATAFRHRAYHHISTPSCRGQEIQEENWTGSRKTTKEIVQMRERKASQEKEALDEKETKILFYDTAMRTELSLSVSSLHGDCNPSLMTVLKALGRLEERK
jgi:hypothetical protein